MTAGPASNVLAHGPSSQLLGKAKSGAVKRLGAKQRQLPGYRKGPAGAIAAGTGMASRRIFAPAFKLKVLDSYRNDIDCRGNQRATARKYGIHRRQIQKWLQGERNLRINLAEGAAGSGPGVPAPPLRQRSSSGAGVQLGQPPAPAAAAAALNFNRARLHGDEPPVQQQQRQQPPPPPASATPTNSSAAAAAAAAVAAAAAAAAQALAAARHQQRQHQHHQQQQRPNYRFPGAPPAASAAPTGYPDFKDLVPRPVQQRYPSPDYSMLELYRPLPSAAYHQQQQQHPQLRQPSLGVFEPTTHPYAQQCGFDTTKVEPSSSSPSASSSASSSASHESELCHYSEPRCGSSASSSLNLLVPSEIKSERASPDSATATPGPCDSASNPSGGPSSPVPALPRLPATEATSELRPQQQQQQRGFKRERPDEEDHRQPEYGDPEYARTASEARAFSPAPSQPDHLESLPPSPRDSVGSSVSFSSCLSSSDSEMDCAPGRRAKPPHRRSFSLRFKLDVLDAFHRDAGVAGNQRATARKFGVNRRQVQKWLIQEADLRDLIELYGSGNRQRLGPLQESLGCAAADEAPVDLRTTSELGQATGPRYGCCAEYAMDSSSLTPPYSTPGCSLSCCSQEPPGTPGQQYYCYSPDESLEAATSAAKRSPCAQSCCYPAPLTPGLKTSCPEEERKAAAAGEQDSPLCLVKPKRSAESASGDGDGLPSPPLASPPAGKRDAILFKPYLDNPVSKPSAGENNNCQEARDLNERDGSSAEREARLAELGFRMPAIWPAAGHRSSSQQQQQQLRYPSSPYPDFPRARSAFVRYPASISAAAHYS